jgi:hypothetical protein
MFPNVVKSVVNTATLAATERGFWHTGPRRSRLMEQPLNFLQPVWLAPTSAHQRVWRFSSELKVLSQQRVRQKCMNKSSLNPLRASRVLDQENRQSSQAILHTGSTRPSHFSCIHPRNFVASSCQRQPWSNCIRRAGLRRKAHPPGGLRIRR